MTRNPGPGCSASTDAAKELLKIERLPLIPGEAGVAYDLLAEVKR